MLSKSWDNIFIILYSNLNWVKFGKNKKSYHYDFIIFLPLPPIRSQNKSGYAPSQVGEYKGILGKIWVLVRRWVGGNYDF